jgi:hypothetical protein
MAIGAALWALAGDGCRWMQNLYYSATMPDVEAGVYARTDHVTVMVAGVKVFQKSYNNMAARESSSDGYDTGHYLLIDSSVSETGNGSVCVSSAVGNAGIGGGGTGIYEAVPQWKRLIKSDNTPLTQGEVEPSTALVWSQRAVHQTGFIDDMGGPRGAYSPGVPRWDTACVIKKPTASTRNYWLWHYSPWAWFGTVPQVVADIAMKCGMDVSAIQADAFDTAHDAYDLTTGDVPYRTASGLVGNYLYLGATSKYEIGCSRTVGERCIDLIKKCIAHARDIYFVNEGGRLCVQSYTRPASQSALSLSDGIIGDIEWKYDNSLLFNVAYTKWGSGVLTYGMVDPLEEQFVSPFSAIDEPVLGSYSGSGMSAVSASQASMDKYGEIQMRGVSKDVNVGGKLLASQQVHYPFHFSCHSVNRNMSHVAAWMRSTGKIPRTATITQDFRALDWGIGSKVLNVAVTDDGQTIPEMWCIERTYDFDRLTVTSVLMEQPPNT